MRLKDIEPKTLTAPALVGTDANGKDIRYPVADFATAQSVENVTQSVENAAQKLEEITYADLKALRDAGKLTPGKQYRITDYVTTTVQADTRSAGHAFDVIVTADSAGVLNENARAALHDGDTYFASAKLQAWKLKYSLDNDTARFAWADTANGKGVIWRMVDEKENDLPYDFKNMQFLREKVAKYLVNDAKWGTGVADLNSSIASVASLRWAGINVTDAEDAIDDNSDTWWSSTESSETLSASDRGVWKVDDEYDLFIKTTGEQKWFYTFSNLAADNADAADASLLAGTYKNKFGYGQRSSGVVSLGKNVLIGNSFYYNTVGNDFYYNTVGNSFRYNTVGNSFYYNTVGNSFYYNTVGNDFYYNTVGNDFYYNTVGNYFYYNTVGNDFYYNTVGNYFYYNTVGNYFYSNTVGNSFYSNTVGNDFYSNTVGNDFYSNTVGNSFYSNTVGNDFMRWCRFGDGCRYISIENAAGGSSSNYVQKYVFLDGTGNLSDSTKISFTPTRNNVTTMNVKNATATTLTAEAA